MERPYIWFHSGAAFLVAAIGSIASAVAAIAIMLNTPSNLWVQLPAAFTICAVGFLPAFLVERRYLSHRRPPRIEVAQPANHDR